MTDELENIPNVANLKEFVAGTMDESKEATKVSIEPVKIEGKTVQFKTLEDAFKAYQEVQGFAARTVQEKKELETQLQELKEQMDLLKYQPSPTVPQTSREDFDTSFIKNPEQAIDAKVTEKVLTARIADVLAEEQTKDQANFMERYQYAQRVVQQMYPQLAHTPGGIRKAFELGDRLRTEDMRRTAERTIKLTFGEDVDLEKFKALIKKDQQPIKSGNNNLAYMPDTGLHSGNRTQAENTGMDQRLNDAVAKGDIDTVIAGTFQKILAQT